jgi:hypothetical protein
MVRYIINNDDYTAIEFDENDLDKCNEIIVTCYYMMTSLSIKVTNYNEIDLNMIKSIQLLKNINKIDKNIKWNKLGYCGYMFISWLNNTLQWIYNTFNYDDQIKNLVKLTFIAGCNLIHDFLKN